MKIRLIDLTVGSKAVIFDIVGGFGARNRLLDLGLTPGAPIEIKAKMPFSGPISIQIRNTQLCIGHEFAKKIIVEFEG